MATIDSWPPEWRALVHEYGFHLVLALRECGVTSPRHAVHVINEVLDELSPFRGSSSFQGPHGNLQNRLVLVPAEPSEAMIAASLETVSNFDIVVSKREKHRLRLRAALRAAARPGRFRKSPGTA